MRDRMERFALLPFSMGCVSESSVAVARPPHLTNTPPNNPLQTPRKFQEWREKEEEEEEEEEREEGDEKTRHPKFRKLLRNFKNLSQLFLYKEDGDDEVGEEEESRMMEIGHPTDVKHVTHIGLDGASTSILSQSWTPSCRMMMDMHPHHHHHHHHHHHDIFFSTTTSPSPTTAATTPATNPPSPASIANEAVHHQPADDV